MSNLVHAVARVRALETDLLTPSHVDRMIGAPSFSQAYAVLDDLGYALDASRSRSNLDFETVLESGLYEAQKIFSLFGIKNIFSILTVMWDIQNIKLALKALKKGDDIEEVTNLMIGYGSYTPYEVAQGVFHGRGLSALSGVLSAAKSADSNQKMEKIIETGLFALAKENAGGDEFLAEYISLLQGAEHVKQHIGESGSIEKAKSNFANSAWTEVLLKAEKQSKESGNFSSLETLIDEKILSFLLLQARGKIEGYAPLFSFYWRKERNTRVIRSVLLAKRAEISAENIRSEFSQFEF